MKKYSLPGFSAAVAVDGKIVWSEAFGEADLENHVPVTRTTRFRLGSVSKVLTAAAAAALYERGLLDLEAPIQRYVPSFPLKQYPITVRELATHTAGIRHYRDPDPLSSGKHYKTVLEGLALFQDDPLLFKPATRYAYSSYGYNLLSAAIEGASKQDFLSFMDEQIFKPLGMVATVPDQSDSIIEYRTRFYYFGDADRKFHNAPYIDASYKWASGGFLSTAEDLVRFGSAHVKPGFFKPETLTLIFTPQRLESGELGGGKDYGVGLAWRIGKNKEGHEIHHHGGAIEGGRAFIFIDAATKITVALLANNFAGFGEVEANEIARFFTAEPVR